MSYLPLPPRDWSRVQNACTYDTVSTIDYDRVQQLIKGNVLQYKANSSNLTSAQKYSKIAQGLWVNRNTTWASQSTRGYTDPNTTYLKRTGNATNLAIDPITGAILGPTLEPITCPKKIVPINEGLPSNGGGGSDVKDPVLPPPLPPQPSSIGFPSMSPDGPPVSPIVIPDGGSLICSIQENVCTGETNKTISQQLCHPTTDSDVPGNIQLLCWNDGTQTWYPKQRYTMSNSTNKWPVNATLLSALRPAAPYITSAILNGYIVTLSWVQINNCLPVSTFDIYQNETLIKTVDSNVFSININVLPNANYTFYIQSRTKNDLVSFKSNVVSLDT